MAFNVTESADTFAEQYASMSATITEMAQNDPGRDALLDLRSALKLGYYYGRAEMGKEMAAILQPPKPKS